MFEGVTVDYDRVQSSTATEDGERIVLALDSPQGPTNISLPTSEVPRLIVAISTAAGMAKAAQAGKEVSLAFQLRSLGVQVREDANEVVFLVELASGSQLLFQTDPQTASQFVLECAQTLGLVPGRGAAKTVQ